MPRYDVHPLLLAGGGGYVVDVQADLLAALATRIVVPLMPEAVIRKPIQDLNPVFEIEGQRHVFVAQALASIPRRELRRRILSLAEHRDIITRALDIVFAGY